MALTNLQGTAADALEQLQRTYENRPGFLAVVFDGSKTVVVVDAARLQEWRAELGPKGIAVAPSCVDPALLTAVRAVIPAIAPPDGIATAGYDGLMDTITVTGVSEEALLAALDKTGMGERARAAARRGTLRVNPNAMSSTP